MSKRKAKTEFRRAMDYIGHLVYERGMRGDFDVTITYRRHKDATTISVLHTDGVMRFHVSDDERLASMTPRQREAWKVLNDLE
jgi:hypothetical protein